MNVHILWSIFASVAMVITWVIAYRRARKTLISRILKGVCRDWRCDLEEKIRENRDELLAGTIHYEYKLSEIRRWLDGTQLTLVDVGFSEALQHKVVRKGASIKTRSLFKKLRSWKDDGLRPVDRQHLLKSLLSELRKSGLNPTAEFCMGVKELGSRFSMTQKEWDEHHAEVSKHRAWIASLGQS